MDERPPCGAKTKEFCNRKSAQECYELGRKADEETYPRLANTASCFVEEAIKKNKKKLLECALERIILGQFDEKPKGPLR